jgi:hypothetical protein
MQPTQTTRSLRLSVVALVAASGCVAADATPKAVASGSADPPAVVEYPDANVRHLRRLANEPRPVEASALPPRHLDEDLFPESLIDRTRIVSGGPPADGIPSIDEPVFQPASEVDWLEDGEAVLALDHDAGVRAYPVRVMTWHEIVNDRIDGIPVAVTYCPLCNSAVAFDRRLDGRELEFGTSGALYLSALVMYDRQTESLWTHFDGRAVVGTLVGSQLELLAVSTVPWSEFRQAHPDAGVLTTDTGYERDYGRNPYVGYEDLERPLSGFHTTSTDPRAPAMSRVVGLVGTDGAVAVATELLEDEGVVTTTLDGRAATVWRAPGLASSLDDRDVSGGRDVGATGAFFVDGDDDPQQFELRGDRFVDAETGSTWDLFGRAVDGPLTGHQLEPITHLDTFWFAWASYQPQTRLLAGGASLDGPPGTA